MEGGLGLNIHDLIRNQKGKTLDMSKLELLYDYLELAQAIKRAEAEQVIRPIKSSGSNNRNPSLANKYRILPAVSKEERQRIQSIIRKFPLAFSTDYYLHNPLSYVEDESEIKQLIVFFQSERGMSMLKTPCSVNERSYQIFGQEKKLLSSDSILIRLGLNFTKLNCYETPEPFFYVSYPGVDSSNILIIENKDTFHTLRLIANKVGRLIVCGEPINILVYGEGKKIIKSFPFINEIKDVSKDNTVVYYFGDIDYEGIRIFRDLAARHSGWNIRPFVELYRATLTAAVNLQPSAQESTEIDVYLNYFSKEDSTAIQRLLASGHFIPQEALSAWHLTNYKLLAEAVNEG